MKKKSATRIEQWAAACSGSCQISRCGSDTHFWFTQTLDLITIDDVRRHHDDDDDDDRERERATVFSLVEQDNANLFEE